MKMEELHEKLLPTLVLALAAALLPGRALAMSCRVVSVTPVSFGAYDGTAKQPLDAMGELVIACKGAGLADTVTVDLSRGRSNAFRPRLMTGPGKGRLRYNLFLDAARTRVWGDGSAGSFHHGPFRPRKGLTKLRIFGRIHAGQSIPAGEYTDNLTVTLNF